MSAREEPNASSSGRERPLVVLVGNPNVGKTTLFNALSGERAHVGNYPGVTVERRTAPVELGANGEDRTSIELEDVPGAYSLSARSPEEQIAIHAVLGIAGCETPNLALVVVDAAHLARNLYLAAQLIELEVPMVVALNMIDEASEAPPSAQKLSALLGVPCVATNARKGVGLAELRRALASAVKEPRTGRVTVKYSREVLEDAERVARAVPSSWLASDARKRALGFWALTSLSEDDELEGVDAGLRSAALDVRAAAGSRDVDHEIIGARYAFLDDVARGACEDPKAKAIRRADRVDRVLLHPVWGFFIFISVMLLVFQSLFAWADPAISLIEAGVGFIGKLAAEKLPSGVVTDLVKDGVIGGVGNVIVFLPQILLLFFFIALLEDSGYMARVAYLVDRVMKAVGLHGRAFVPMLSGFACAVPAILATRTMEQRRDRVLTMLVIPLMTCSARLPVYTLVIAALFPPSAAFGGWPVQGGLLVGMYLFSIALTLLVAAVLGRTVVKGRRIPLILELPPYRMPSLRSIVRSMLERALVFLKEAGTVILVCTIALWALLNFPRPEPNAAAPRADAAEQARAIEGSWGGRVGKALEPAIAPLGFDWKIGVGLIGAFAAREVFVSTLAIVHGAGEVDDEATPLRDRLRAETRADGKPAYTPLTGLSLMVFFAIACQCMSTVAVVRRETKSWRWPIFLFAYTGALAYVASLLVYQGGRALGFG